MVFVGTLIVTSESDSEIDEDVIADLASEAGTVVQITASECAIRNGSLADMQGVVIKSGTQLPAILSDQRGQDYGNGRVSLTVTLPVTISFLLQYAKGWTLFLIEEREFRSLRVMCNAPYIIFGCI